MRRPSNLIVDERELDGFISWLPDLEPHQAYLAQLMIRSRGLKEKYGFKGSDHVLMFRAVHGYLRAVTPDGRVYWRVRLKHDIMRLGLLGAQGGWEYANYEPGGRVKIRHLVRVPWQIIAVYININPADTIRALQLTTKELVDSLAGMAHSRGLEMYTEFFRRPDQRYYANLARSTKTRFHVVDADTKELFELVLELFQETFGFMPERILTHRGGHVLIDIAYIRENGLEKRYTGRMGGEITTLVNWYSSNKHNKQVDPRRLEEAREKLLGYVNDNSQPFFHRMKVLSILYTDEKGAPLVELKKQALEPVPGSIYKGKVIIRFLQRER